MRRRTFLERGALVGAVALAGCIGQPSETVPVATDPTSPTGTPSASPTREPTDASPSPTVMPTDMATPTADYDSDIWGYDDPTATATPSETGTRTASTPTETPPPSQTVIVAPYGELRFDPASFEIEPGATVRWIWEAGGHNVKPSSTPGSSDWSGTAGSTLFSAGHAYAFTFEVAGTYEYYCAPHRASGMTGSFRVE